MATTIAAFPLGLVCFPGEIQNLHIFEPRYRQLISDCITDEISFAIVPYLNNKAFHLATEIKLHEIAKEYPDGKYDVAVKAIGLVKVHRLTKKMTGKEYPGVKISPLSWDEKPSLELSLTIVPLIKRLYSELGIQDIVPAPKDFLVRKVVHKLGLSVEQELSLLAIPEEENRQQYILNHLLQFVPTIEKANELRLKAVLNGHFKNINPANF